ncbi:MAG: glycosyltransferase family 2 protein [Candidatus Melainabacteria bacterium]|nr:glycosyltransferase family 2 protein [Candidatus Melainabacteria bacterium]
MEDRSVSSPFPVTQERRLGVDVSFIIPVYNEVDNVDAMVAEVLAAGERLNHRPFELIVVDDGSCDGTRERLASLVSTIPELKVILLRRNFGQTAATAAGFYYASGRYLATLDGDLQNDPADVPRLLHLLETEDLDIVTGWRQNRQDTVLTRKLPSRIANWLIGVTTGVRLRDYGCSLKVYRAEVAKSVPLYGEMHRFIPALASIDGARIQEVPVSHRPRTRGQSKYNLSRTFKVVLDLMTVLFLKRFLTRPLHMFGRLGLLFFSGGFAINLYLVLEKLLWATNIGGRPLLMFGILLMLTGIQLLSTGLIAELQVRTYFESQNKPIYKVRAILGAGGQTSELEAPA